MRLHTLVIPALALAAAAIPVASVSFEKAPMMLHGGKPAKSLKILSRRAQGLLGIYAAPGERGMDLYFVNSSDVGESWSEPQRINHVPGEVSDHGENSAQFFLSPDEMTMYAFWNARDPKNPAASHVRFSSGGAMMTKWTPAVTVDDDPGPNSHGFQGAAVGPDGTLYAAWLDGRDKESSKTADYTAGASAVYVTRSTDGGKTWTKNTRVAVDVCPCCRVAFGFSGGRVLLTWRGVEAGDYRDIWSAVSSDRGETWSKPKPVSRDRWKIKGCPHVGAAMATVGDKLHVIWFSEAGGTPGIYMASTIDGSTFTPKRLLSEGTTDATHPQVAAYDGRLAVTFQARDAKADDSWGKMSIYYREIGQDGSMSPVQKAGSPLEGSVTYPALTLGMSGRTFLSWTEVRGEQGPRAMLLRGRWRKL